MQENKNMHVAQEQRPLPADYTLGDVMERLRCIEQECRRQSQRLEDGIAHVCGMLQTQRETECVRTTLSRMYYTVPQAAELLHMDAATVRRYCRSGAIRAAQCVGRSYRIPAEALEMFMRLNPHEDDDVPA